MIHNPTDNHNTKNKKELLQLTWPIFCEAILFSIIGSVDVIMLSRYSDNAVGAVGVVNQILFLFQVLSNIITTGTAILCAQYIGAGKSLSEKQPLILGALMVNTMLGLVFSIGIGFFSDTILTLMDISDELYIHGKQYLSIVGSFQFVQMIAMTFTTLIRVHGKTTATMVFSLIMNLCNLVLNYIFIYGKLGFPVMGTAGAATATVISKALACIMAGLYLFGKVIPGMSFLPDGKATVVAIKKILSYGAPAAGEQISYTLSKLVVTAMVTTLGTVAVNTYSYVNIIVSFTYLFSMALGQGTSIIVGWEVGKKQIQEAKSICLFSVRCSLTFAIIAVGILCLVRREIMSLFTENPEIIAMGAAVILTDFILEAGRSQNLILVNALRAAGDVRFPLYIGLFSMWFFSVGLSWLLGIGFNLGLAGIWIGIGLDECFRAVGMQIRWQKGNWIRHITEKI